MSTVCLFFTLVGNLIKKKEDIHYTGYNELVHQGSHGDLKTLKMVMEKSWKNILSSMWEPWSIYC